LLGASKNWPQEPLLRVKAQAKPTKRTANNVTKTFLDIGTKRPLSSCCEKKSIVNFKYRFSVRGESYCLIARTGIWVIVSCVLI
jgi:hypothetical protein